MQADEYRRMYELESHYWWFVARRRLALKLLRKTLSVESPKVLDLGCGTGAVLQELSSFTTPYGVDMSPLALGFCRSRNLCNLAVGRGENLPIRSETMDAVVGLDVFEHI